jgi:hypothetical protein
MDKVQKPSNSVCYTPSSEPYRIYSSTFLLADWRQQVSTNELDSTLISSMLH